MYKARYPHSIRRWSLKAIIAGIVWVIGICLFATLGNAMTTYAAGVPGGDIANPVVRAVDIAEPSVVRIITTTSGRLTVHFSANNDVTFPQGNGQIYQLQLSGSGTFISSKGDILTADHVVNPPAQALQEAAAQDVAAYINQNPKLGLGSVSANQVAQELETNQLQSSASYDTTTSQVFLSTSYTGPLNAQDLAHVPSQDQATVDKIEKQSAVDQEDTAIVHATFNFDTPSVQLADSSGVQQQDQLTIIGFPGNGDVSNSPTDLLTSSVNTISVSSIKTTDTGAPVIQVSGNVEHGDSGGPALDSNGDVVGIVSFGLSTPDSPGGTSFLQASNSARSLIQSLNLDTTPGPFQKLWSQAFTSYAANTRGHWHAAAQEFQQLATRYPQFQAVKPYLTYAQAQARTEVVTPTAKATATPNKQPASIIPSLSRGALGSYALMIGGVVLVLILAFVLFAAVFRRGKKNKKPGPPQGQVQTQAPAQAQTPPVAKSLPTTPPARAGSGMEAFGAPPVPGTVGPQSVQPQQARPTMPPPPLPQPGMPSGTFSTATLRVWPCGHMNRPNARFCSVCGEPAPAPPPTIKRVEQ
jgi:serine protease Do